MNISLNGEWDLFRLVRKRGRNLPYGIYPDTSKADFHIKATVPGEVQSDIFAAGIEGDPYYSDNYYNYIKYEKDCFLYERVFTVGEIPDEDIILRFDGIETIADIFINGDFAGHCENGLVEHEFDITDFIKTGENTVSVHLFSVVNYARSISYPVGVRSGGDRDYLPYIRKAPHSFGWDIFPRLVTTGLWKDVTVYSRPANRITETYFKVSSVNGTHANLRWSVRFVTDFDDFDGLELKLRGVCGDSEFSADTVLVSQNAQGCIGIDGAKLWWPAGYGEADLYDVTVEILRFGEKVAEKHEKIGLRHIRLERDFTPDSQKFAFIINNVPVFCKGSNHVPADALHSKSKKRAAEIIGLVRDAGCNIIRSWGGGIYEDDILYDLCDRYGILVWQDFCFGNAVYPQDGCLDDNITDEITKVVKRLRSHACLALWSSDNEIDQSLVWCEFPEDYIRRNNITEYLIPNLIKQHDPYAYYIKSSPSVPEGFNTENVPEQHTWGARAWYKDRYYAQCTASFIGEAGYHGCPSPESLEKFIPAECLGDMFSRPWRAHSTEDLRYSPGRGRNDMMRKQVKILCGEIPENLGEFAKVSQFSQAEAFKFFIENSRIQKPDRSGIIWWNIADGWPQISDAVTDYYGAKKTAYYWIRQSQQPVLVHIGELSGWSHKIHISNDTLNEYVVSYKITDAGTGEILAQGNSEVGKNGNVCAGEIRLLASDKKLLLIEYSYGGKTCRNHYLTGMPGYDKDDIIRWSEMLTRIYSE